MTQKYGEEYYCYYYLQKFFNLFLKELLKKMFNMFAIKKNHNSALN